jgi:transcriptional regulator with XRE-family HTH domain
MTSRPVRTPDALAAQLGKTLGVNVRRNREALGLGQRELADAVGTSQRRIVLIENARGNPTIMTLCRLSLCLKVSVVDLLTPL